MNEDAIVITFVGDVALHSAIGKTSIDPFEYIRDKLNYGDLLIANLESPFRGERGENLEKRPRIIGEEENLRILEKLKPDVVSLANNHICDALEDGFDKTVVALEKLGIGYYGAGTSVAQASRPFIIKKNNISLGILFYLTPDTNPNLPEKSGTYLNFLDEQKIAGDIFEIKKRVDTCIVYIHWGVEYIHVPGPTQQSLAHNLITAGADCVIGSHTHVIQPLIKDKDHLIAYGLGNFYFPNFAFEGNVKNWKKSGRESMILSVEVNKDGCSIAAATGVVLKDGQLYVRNGFLGFRLGYWKILSFFYGFETIWRARIWVFHKKNEMYWFMKRTKRFILRKGRLFYRVIL